MSIRSLCLLLAAFSTAGHRLVDLDVAVDARRSGPVPGGYGIAFGFANSVPVEEYYALYRRLTNR